jgi:hypothetical protein
MRGALSVLAFFLASGMVRPGTLGAQTQPAAETRASLEARLSHENAAAPVAATFPGRLLSALGGAAIGAGMGFFASQVVRGDWDDERGTGIDRSAWAAVGGSIGLAMGFSFPLGPGRSARGQTIEPNDRRVLRAAEWKNTGVTTAYDAVRLLRPEWLRGRGVHIIGESAEETIVVVLDQVRLGGIGTLREVSIQMVRSVEFVDPGPATVRWGAGHSHGVILITAEGGIAKDQGSENR